MKKLLIILVLLTMPLLAFATWTQITNGYDGAPNSYASSYWETGAEVYWKVTPSYTTFTLDTVGVEFYRYSGASNNLTFRIKVYRPNGTADGDCACTTGPGQAASDSLYSAQFTASVFYPNFSYYRINPPLAINGPFIVSVKYVSHTTSGGTSWPSVMWDAPPPSIPCCNQYWHFPSAYPPITDNEGFWSTTPGPVYGLVRGGLSGSPLPGVLTIAGPNSMGRALMDSTVTDTLILGNSGALSLTLSSVTSSNAAFTRVFSGLVIAPGATAKMAIRFTPSAVEGLDSTTFTFTDDQTLAVHTFKIYGQGLSHTNVELFENWWNDNGHGDWMIQRFGALDAQDWGIFYTGAHTGDWTNLTAGHQFSLADSFVVDVIGSPMLAAPPDSVITIGWREQTQYPTYVRLHELLLADVDTTWYEWDSLGVAANGQWRDYPTTYYIQGLGATGFESYGIGFLYAGADAENWFVDDIMIKKVPQLPPEFQVADPRGDAFSSNHEITCDAFDPNGDPFTATAHVQPAAGSFGSYAMTETPAGSGHFCVPFANFLNGAGEYNYYLTAQDANGSTRWPTTGAYTFDVQSQLGSTELLAHDTTDAYAIGIHYYYSPLAIEAEKFTPPSYPFNVTAAGVATYHLWPEVSHEQVHITVFDDNGPSGLPGSVLWEETVGSIGNECDTMLEGLYWNTVVINPATPLVIDDGSFYVGINNISTNGYEAWALDSSISDAYVYNPTSSTWSSEVYTLWVDAIGYPQPAAPEITCYRDPTGTAIDVYVGGGTGTIPATNLYVATAFDGTYDLVAGSPFTSSPIVVPFDDSPMKFFKATSVGGGPTDLLRTLPAADPRVAPIRLAANNPMGTVVENANSVALFGGRSPGLMKTHKDGAPRLVAHNETTGENTVLGAFTKKLGKAHATTAMSRSQTRGPVRTDTMIAKGFINVTAK